MLINNKIKKLKNNRKIINFKPKILLKKKYNNKIIKMNKNQKIIKMVFLCYQKLKKIRIKRKENQNLRKINEKH